MAHDTNGDRSPLLNYHDVEVPLSTDDLVYVAEVMTKAGQDPDDAAQQALAFYRRKEVVRLMGNATFSATGMSERLDNFESQLPAKVGDTEFMQDLMNDFASLSTVEAPTKRQLKLPDLLGIRARRDHKQRIVELREKTLNSENRLSIHDLREGDNISITSGYRLPRDEGELLGRWAKNVISGEIIEFGSVGSLEAVALKVAKDTNRGSMEFVHAKNMPVGLPTILDGPPFVSGQTIYIAGTTFLNGCRANPSSIAVGEALEIFSKNGEPRAKHVIFREGELTWGIKRDDVRMVPVTGMKINGDEVFHKRV